MMAILCIFIGMIVGSVIDLYVGYEMSRALTQDDE